MVTGDAIFLGVLMLAAIGITVASFMLGRVLLFFIGGFVWAAFGLWAINLIPAPVGNATLPDLTATLAGAMAVVLMAEGIRRAASGRVDYETRTRTAHIQRLDEITADDDWDESGRRRIVEGRAKALPERSATYRRGVAVLAAMNMKKKWYEK